MGLCCLDTSKHIWIVLKLVAHHFGGTLKLERFEQPTIGIEAHHKGFALKWHIEGLLHLSIFTYRDLHRYGACFRRIVVFSSFIRCRNGKGKIDGSNKAWSKIIDTLGLLD